MSNYFDEPRETPRYRGVSAPVFKWDARAIELAKPHAIVAAYQEWADSPDREHWVPDGLTVQVEEYHTDFFIRGKVAVVARMTGRPVLPMPPEVEEA